jgi:hypothetical protein
MGRFTEFGSRDVYDAQRVISELDAISQGMTKIAERLTAIEARLDSHDTSKALIEQVQRMFPQPAYPPPPYPPPPWWQQPTSTPVYPTVAGTARVDPITEGPAPRFPSKWYDRPDGGI